MRWYAALALAALLASGCAHKQTDRPWVAHPEPGDRQVPIREPLELVGRFRSVLGDGEKISFELNAGVLVLRNGRGETYRTALQQDGTLSIPGHHGARLIHRSCLFLLQVTWAYRWALYEVEPQGAEAELTERC